MKLATNALLVSLIVLLAAIIIVFFLKEEPPRPAPRGVPRGTSMAMNPVVSGRSRRAPKREEPKRRDSPPTQVTPAAPTAWGSVEVKAQIVFESQPLAGARFFAEPIFEEPDGYRSPSSPFRFATMQNAPTSTDDGSANFTMRYPKHLPGDSVIAVVAYHQEKGTAYAEATLDEVQSNVVQLKIERGEVVVGRVISPNAEPIANAHVKIGARTPAEKVSISDLGITTGPDGTFMIPGVRFGNVPVEIVAIKHVEEYHDGSLVRERGAVVQGLSRERHFRDLDKTWDVGDITLEIRVTTNDG